jgi:hypothetical protein
MSVLALLSGIVKPLGDAIDSIFTSDEERGEIEVKKAELKAKLAELEQKVATRMLDLQGQALEANARVAISEQISGNSLSKSWRPLTSLTFVGLIVAMSMGKIEYREEVVNMGMLFLGVYAGGRSIEKKRK